MRHGCRAQIIYEIILKAIYCQNFYHLRISICNQLIKILRNYLKPKKISQGYYQHKSFLQLLGSCINEALIYKIYNFFDFYMRLHKIVGISLVVQLVITITNLIKIPDFEGIPLTSYSVYSAELVDLRPDWYHITDGSAQLVEIRTIDPVDTNQWMDIEPLTNPDMICQTVDLIPGALHILTFKYLLTSGVVDANISIILNSQLIEEFVADPSGVYNNTLFGSQIQGINQLCFNGDSQDPAHSTGVLIDDIQLTMEQRVDFIHFVIEVDQNNNQSIFAFGNYTIQASQLLKFQAAWINYGNLSIAPLQVFLNNTKIDLQFNLNESFDSSKNISIQLGNIQYLDFDYALINFVSSYEIVYHNNTQAINNTNNTQAINSTNNTQSINNTNNTQAINSTNNTQAINNTNNTQAINSTNNTQSINNTNNTQAINSTNNTQSIKATNSSKPSDLSRFNQTKDLKSQEEESDRFIKFFYSIDFSILEYGYENARKAQTLLVWFLVTSFIFKFINFANIMVLYIFLDIVLLDADVRNVFECLAAILLKDGIFSSLYSLISGSSPDFMEFHINLSEKVPSSRIHAGSPFSIIELTTNTIKLCLEDSGLILFNGMKLLIIYLIINQIKSKKWIKPNQWKFKQQLKRAFYIEIISVAPMWVLASGICLSYSDIAVIAHKNIREKMNILMLILLPFIMFCGALGWRMVQTPTTVVVDAKAKISKRIAKKKLQYNPDPETNLQWFVILNYSMFGFLVSGFPIIVFFTVATLSKLAILGYQLKTMTKKKYDILQMIRMIIEFMIHGGFLTLFIFDKIGIDELNSSFDVEKVVKYISILTLYTYIFGCVFEIIIFIFEFFMDAWQIISFLYQSGQKATQDLQETIKGRNFSIQSSHIPISSLMMTINNLSRHAKPKEQNKKEEMEHEEEMQGEEEMQREEEKPPEPEKGASQQKEFNLPQEIQFPEGYEKKIEGSVYLMKLEMIRNGKPETQQYNDFELYLNNQNKLCVDQMGRQKAKREQERKEKQEKDKKAKEQNKEKTKVQQAIKQKQGNKQKLKLKSAKKIHKQNCLNLNYTNEEPTSHIDSLKFH